MSKSVMQSAVIHRMTPFLPWTNDKRKIHLPTTIKYLLINSLLVFFIHTLFINYSIYKAFIKTRLYKLMVCFMVLYYFQLVFIEQYIIYDFDFYYLLHKKVIHLIKVSKFMKKKKKVFIYSVRRNQGCFK